MAVKSEGIQGFSRHMPELALWAADKAHTDVQVRGYLTSLGIEFTPCLGCYKGETEMSYLTTREDFNRVGNLVAEQESALILGSKDSLNRHKATLVFLLSLEDDVDLGRLYSLPIAEALKRDAWTIPLNQDRTARGEILAFCTGFPDIHGKIT